jgi:hypothetical protein
MLHNLKYRDLYRSRKSVAVVKFMTLQWVPYVTILGRQGVLTEFPWGSIWFNILFELPRVICHNGKLM